MRLLRAYGFEVLVVVGAVVSAVDGAPEIGAMEQLLLARRRFPFAAPAALWLVAASLSFADGRVVTTTPSATVAGVVAAFLLGRLREDLQARVGLAIAVAAAAIIVYNDPTHESGELIFVPALFAIGWVIGFALREQGEQTEAAEARALAAERERELAARVAVADERARIARELHDIVAHSVSVMVLQVGSVRHGLPGSLSEEREALEGVERTGRTALVEMRRLLGAMRARGDGVELAPQPGLGALDALVEQVGRAGLSVQVRVEGEAVSLPAGVDLSAYRIVQEGLTNALKHARAREAEVRLRYGADELRIEVRNDGGAAAPGQRSAEGSGYGLVGVRERVRVYGGEMDARALDGGGFVLSTRLPLRGEAA